MRGSNGGGRLCIFLKRVRLCEGKPFWRVRLHVQYGAYGEY